MVKKYKKTLLSILLVGIVLLAWLIESGKGNCFVYEAIVILVVLLVAVFQEIKLNHRFMNAILLIAFWVAGFGFLFGVIDNLFVSVNLLIYIGYLINNNRNLTLALKKQTSKSNIFKLVLQNYQQIRRAS